MEFLGSAQLKNRVCALLAAPDTKAKIAVAYWGGGALDRLKLNPRRRNIQVLCCLKGGKSDPDVIKMFGDRARQLHKLHAKVIWTPRGAIVGSANASSNGLPSEEEMTNSLIEAGVYLDDQGTLRQIADWFDELYGRGSRITQSDLAEAKLARTKFPPKRPRGRKQSLLEALFTSPADFEHTYFYLYEEYCTRAENRAVEHDLKKQIMDISKKLTGNSNSDILDWYTFTSKPPKSYFPTDAILIEGRYLKKAGRIPSDEFYFRKTFGSNLQKIDVDGTNEWAMLVQMDPRLTYKVSRKDKHIISVAASELWRLGRKGVEKDRMLKLTDAQPILEKYWLQNS